MRFKEGEAPDSLVPTNNPPNVTYLLKTKDYLGKGTTL